MTTCFRLTADIHVESFKVNTCSFTHERVLRLVYDGSAQRRAYVSHLEGFDRYVLQREQCVEKLL